MVFYSKNKSNAPQVDIVKLVDDIFIQANSEGASDIHFEPIREKMIIRFSPGRRKAILNSNTRKATMISLISGYRFFRRVQASVSLSGYWSGRNSSAITRN